MYVYANYSPIYYIYIYIFFKETMSRHIVLKH